MSKQTFNAFVRALSLIGLALQMQTEAAVVLNNNLLAQLQPEKGPNLNREDYVNGQQGQLLFEEYLKVHDKNYVDPVDFAGHKTIYETNLKIVEILNSNADDDAYYTANNMYGDIHTTTMVQQLLVKTVDSNEDHMLATLPTEGLPESFDWRDHGAVTEVRNQGSAGSCWSFSAAEATEGAQFLKHKKLEKLSPEFLVECDPKDCGVYGGFPSNAYEFVMAEGGFVKESAIPYCAGGGEHTCTPCMAPHYNQTLCGKVKQGYCNHKRNVCDVEKMHPGSVGAKIVDWKQLVQDEDQIKAALVKYGPLSVALNAQWLQFYAWGISNPLYCPPQLNHAVLLVGYGVELGYFTGRQKPYWILKNSWSDGWGEKGYFRLGRGNGICGINTACTFPIVA